MQFTKKIFQLSALLILVSGLIVGSIPVQSVSAQSPKCDENFYSANDVLFYNPCETTCSGGSGGAINGTAPSALIGASNKEKAWNYFAARGLTPVAAAGAMGNIQHESSFSASVEEASGGGGLGIIQWTGDRRTKLEAAAAAAGVSLVDNDSALLFQLNYLWDGEYQALTWQEQVNAETTVNGNPAIASFWGRFNDQRAESQAGNGSTMVFHALVERSGDVPTEADRIPGHGVLQGRIDTANEILTEFNGTSAGGSCSINSGGLTWEQAVELAKKLIDKWDSIYCGTNITGGNNGGYCNWTEGYCTAGAAWMATVTAPSTSTVAAIPHGVNVANRLVSNNPELYTNANPDGSNLQPFSVWSFGDGSATSEPGHTGTIVGVKNDGSIITLETNWGNETVGATQSFLYNTSRRAAVFEYPSFEAFKNSRGGYVYNNTATPKDSSIAQEMATKMTAWIGAN